MATDVYYTLGERALGETKVRGSRFIGYAAPVAGREEAEVFIREISSKHHDATHNCYAYRVGVGDDSLFRYSDAGEPSGTAGKPILEAIDGHILTDVVCVVARYFGGTKLGTGRLARAYAQCAGKVLDGGERVERFLTVHLRIAYAYDLTGIIMGLVSRYGCGVVDTSYGSEATMVLRVRQGDLDAFEQNLQDATAGKVKVSREGVRGC